MFTQKLSMDCTKEQYEKYLKEELGKMGYKLYSPCYTFTSCTVITNCYNGDNGVVSELYIEGRETFGRTYLGSFNAPLFLALAAMTDKLKGGYGEWWLCIRNSTSFTLEKMYKQISYTDGSPNFIDDVGDVNGKAAFLFSEYFHKASAEEIMAHFAQADKLSAEPQTLKEPVWKQCEELIDEYEAIHLLKTRGYKIFKQKKTLEEI